MTGAGDPRTSPGLHVERTRLAWQRTALACTVLSGSQLALAARYGRPAGVVAAAVAAVLVAAALVRSVPWRVRRPADPLAVRSTWDRLLPVCLALVAVAAAAVVEVLAR